MSEKSLDMLGRVKVTPEQEEEKKMELYNEAESIAELKQRIEAMREEAATTARAKDIDYVCKMDNLIKAVLDAVSESEEDIKRTVQDMIKEGNMKAVKDLFVALGITIDKREMLLGFDETRKKQDGRQRLKFEVLWKSGDGSQAGVRIEQSSE